MLQAQNEYYALRLEQELAMAQEASSSVAAAIHMELALAYQNRLPEHAEQDRELVAEDD